MYESSVLGKEVELELDESHLVLGVVEDAVEPGPALHMYQLPNVLQLGVNL
jgi:hypothetical protein